MFMRKSLVFLSLGTMAACTFLGIFILNALAKEPPRPKTVSILYLYSDTAGRHAVEYCRSIHRGNGYYR